MFTAGVHTLANELPVQYGSCSWNRFEAFIQAKETAEVLFPQEEQLQVLNWGVAKSL